MDRLNQLKAHATNMVQTAEADMVELQFQHQQHMRDMAEYRTAQRAKIGLAPLDIHAERLAAPTPVWQPVVETQENEEPSAIPANVLQLFPS